MLQKHTSRNGLRIVLENIASVRSVTIGVWVRTGSRDETVENNGISHFLEHMFFKGTEKRTAKEIAEEFDAIGGQVNAFTSKEYTCYYAKVLDTHKEFALEMLTDMFFHSKFAQEEIDKEKNVVLEEIKMAEDTPDDIVHDLLAEASYGGQPLGFPILGIEERLNAFTSEDLHQYQLEHYRPDNIVISVAGNVDTSFIDKIETAFDQFKQTSKVSTLEKSIFTPKQLTRKKETEQAHLCLGYQGLPIGATNIFSLVIVNNVLGGSMSSRLFQEIRENRGLAYSVFSYHSSFLDDGLLTIYAGTGNEHLPVLKETIHQTVAELIEHGLTDKELRNSKEQLKGNLVLGLESTNSRMSRNGKNELLMGKHRSLDELITEIDAVSMESTNELIKQIFKSDYASALISS
ncbi:M16 family metallopeptidase [Paraliobacillus sediminis]|uniref:M16 family metallopeptidase n=1 Tax=Paraliobacillus sediminis TaxID=1885916 RepID=UPI000E3BD67B|nr:pitrilysin family protein [Paraliobacillus sediminis]